MESCDPESIKKNDNEMWDEFMKLLLTFHNILTTDSRDSSTFLEITGKFGLALKRVFIRRFPIFTYNCNIS